MARAVSQVFRMLRPSPSRKAASAPQDVAARQSTQIHLRRLAPPLHQTAQPRPVRAQPSAESPPAATRLQAPVAHPKILPLIRPNQTPRPFPLRPQSDALAKQTPRGNLQSDAHAKAPGGSRRA